MLANLRPSHPQWVQTQFKGKRENVTNQNLKLILETLHPKQDGDQVVFSFQFKFQLLLWSGGVLMHMAVPSMLNDI